MSDYNGTWTEPSPKSWTDTAADTARSAADKARSYAPQTYDRSVQAANYVSGSIREHPLSASAVLPLLGYVLGFLLHHQSSDIGSARYSARSWTDAAADTAQSAADKARSAAPETYDRAGQVINSAGGSIGLSGLVAAAFLGYALGLVSKSNQNH